MLAGQDFSGRQHGGLIPVLDGDHGGLGSHQRFAAADVALQQPAHGMRSLHVLRDLFQHAVCAPVGLNGSMALIFSRTRSFNSNEMPGCNRALERFSDKPHSSQKNSSKISRQCAGVRYAFSMRKSESGAGKCRERMAVQRSRSFSRSRNVAGRWSSSGSTVFEHAMHQRPQRARGYLARPFVNCDDAAGVERGVAVGIVAGENFELGMHDEQVAGVAVEFHFAVQRDAHAGQEPVGQIAAVKPFGEQPLARCILENRFEESEIAAAESAQVSGLDFGDNRGHFARRELRDGLDVGAVFVAKWRVGQQILNRDQPLGFEHLGARGTNAFDELERSGSIQRRKPLRVQVPVYNGGPAIPYGSSERPASGGSKWIGSAAERDRQTRSQCVLHASLLATTSAPPVPAEAGCYPGRDGGAATPATALR